MSEGGAELACFCLFLVLMEVCVDFDAAFLVTQCEDLPFSVVNSDGFDVDVGCPPTDKIICGRLV